MPIFTQASDVDADAPSMTWQPYLVVAAALRRGSTRDAGHYQALLYTHQQVYLCDDARSARSISYARALREVRDAFLVWAVRADVADMSLVRPPEPAGTEDVEEIAGPRDDYESPRPLARQTLSLGELLHAHFQ